MKMHNMENLEKTMPMFVWLAGYLDVLVFPLKFNNVYFKTGIFISETYKKKQNTPSHLNLCLYLMGHN